jgi:hypothetical protein
LPPFLPAIGKSYADGIGKTTDIYSHPADKYPQAVVNLLPGTNSGTGGEVRTISGSSDTKGSFGSPFPELKLSLTNLELSF